MNSLIYIISEVKPFTFFIEDIYPWVTALLFIFLLGTLFTGMMMSGLASFVREKDESGIATGSKLTGKTMPVVGCSFKYNAKEFKEKFLDIMPLGSIEVLKQWLRFDYYFMAFLYPFMFFLCIYISNYSFVANEEGEWFCSFVESCKWLSLIIWVFDIFENRFSLLTITDLSDCNLSYTNLPEKNVSL